MRRRKVVLGKGRRRGMSVPKAAEPRKEAERRGSETFAAVELAFIEMPEPAAVKETKGDETLGG